MKESAGKCAHSWSIAWICCFINFLLLGVSRLSGLLYLASISRFGVERSKASLPFVLCYAVRNVSGPLIGYVGRRVEIRLLVACGCFLSALGAGACFFAEDITTVTVLWGGVHGLGFGLGTILLPQILNQHFEKYIAIANGIAFGGECVAGFVLPVIVELFLDTYGTSGTFLILSGLILHGVPAALLLKSPKSFSKQSDDNKINNTKEKYQYDSVKNVCMEDSCHNSDHSFICNTVDGQEKCSKSPFKTNKKLYHSICPLDSDNSSDRKNFETLKKRFCFNCGKDKLSSSVSDAAESDLIRRVSEHSSCYQFDYKTDTILDDAVKHNINSKEIADYDIGKCCKVLQSDAASTAKKSSPHSTYCHQSNNAVLKDFIHSQGCKREQSHKNRVSAHHSTNCPSSLEEDTSEHSNDILHGEFPTTIKSNDITNCENQTLNQSNFGIRFEDPTLKQSNNIHCENKTIKQSDHGENLTLKPSDNIHHENSTIRHSESSIHCESSIITQSNRDSDATKRSSFYAFRVFFDPPFILILLAQSSMIFIFTTVLTVIVDFSRDAGVSGHQEVYVLMCLSVSDMIGRFGLGWVTDLRYMSNITFSAVCYAGTGILMVALVYLRGFPSMMTVAFFIGLFLGGLLIVGPGIIMDYVEEDQVTMALASRLVLFAPMSLTQSSLIGFFREKLGSYNGLFYILGVNSVLCCVFSLMVPCAFKWRSRRSKSNPKT